MIGYPAPPVCTAQWTQADWQRYEELHGVEMEPLTIVNFMGTWTRTDKRDANGDALYNLDQQS